MKIGITRTTKPTIEKPRFLLTEDTTGTFISISHLWESVSVAGPQPQLENIRPGGPHFKSPQKLGAPSFRSFIAEGWETTNLLKPPQFTQKPEPISATVGINFFCHTEGAYSLPEVRRIPLPHLQLLSKAAVVVQNRGL
jgi:hypothetical protein